MIYVTHDQVEAMTLGWRIVVMDEGVIQQAAGPLEVYDRPSNRFVAGFIGTPPMNFIEGDIVAQNGSISFDTGSTMLRLPGWMKRSARDYVSRKVCFGIRPEDVTSPEPGENAPAGSTIPAKINVVELLGDESIVYFSIGSQELVAKILSHHRLHVNDELDMRLDMDKAHIFDADTGENVTLRDRPEVQ